MPLTKKRTKTEFEPWMVQALKDHIKEGWSVSCFPGRYKINKDAWLLIINSNPELNEIRTKYNAMKVKTPTFFKHDA